MSKYLVVIEAVGKVGKIQSYLGSDYEVVATSGHFRDLPKKEIGIDFKKNFEPTYSISSDKKDLVNNIINKAKKAKMVYLFTDLDREGEFIAFHLSQIFPKEVKYERAVSHSITKAAIEDAIKNTRTINMDLVNAAEARRLLDRICGFRTSFPVKIATGGPSAGRVQSAGLRILVDRENEITSFIPEIYWPVEAELITKDYKKIYASIKTPKPLDIKTEDEANKIIKAFKDNKIKVSKYDIKQENVNPYAPFITSTLQQTASSVLGFTSDRTMKAAQNLYQAGLCTYHRTDSTNIIPEFVTKIRDTIKSSFGDKYLPTTANSYIKKVTNAQEAHEACRASDITVKSYAGGNADEAKLYELIWKRTVASQMVPAKYERRSAEFSVDKYSLGANGSKQTFDGFKKVWTYSDSTEVILPDLAVGDEVNLVDISTEKKETQPPSRYSESSFIKELEKRSIGRPSTYASIIKTLRDRSYIEDKQKVLKPTELGIKVSEFLVKANFCFVDLEFTKNMEDKLDKISNKLLNKNEVLKEFYDRLKTDLVNCKTIKKEVVKSGHSCPNCGGDLLIRQSQYGKFLGCSNYSNKENKCKSSFKIAEDGSPLLVEKKVVVYSDFKCDKCDGKMIERKGKYGTFYGCESYPKCNGMKDSSGIPIEKKEGGKKKKFYKKSKKEA